VPNIEYDARINLSMSHVHSYFSLSTKHETCRSNLGSNAVVTYDVRLAYKTEDMFEDAASEWILEVQSRESRSIHCQPIYHHEKENRVGQRFIVNNT
jgi:hypothetical protein